MTSIYFLFEIVLTLFAALTLQLLESFLLGGVFFFLTCCISAGPKSTVTSNSLTLYVGHLSKESNKAAGMALVRLRATFSTVKM